MVAPLLYIDVATGITPQEQSGIGTPRNAAFKIDPKPGVPTFFVIISFEVRTNRNPDMINPIIKYGAIII